MRLGSSKEVEERSGYIKFYNKGNWQSEHQRLLCSKKNQVSGLKM